MAGYGRVVVGFRRADRRSYRTDEYGQPTVRAGRCIGCGADVYLLPSGVSSLRERDANVICDEPCYRRDKHLVQEAL